MGGKRLEGIAIVTASSRQLERDDAAWLLPDLGANRFGRRRYEFTLDVRVPGIEPYAVQDRFEAMPGRKQAIAAAQIEAQRRLLGEIYARKHGDR